MNTSRQVEQRKSIEGSLPAADCNEACLSIHLTQLSKPPLQLLLLSFRHAFTIGITVCLNVLKLECQLLLWLTQKHSSVYPIGNASHRMPTQCDPKALQLRHALANTQCPL